MGSSEAAAGNRRLAAVMFLDMVGYSALMSRSETAALGCVKELEALLRAEVPGSGGRLVKFMGDGSLAEFQTAGAAVACARTVLERLSARNSGRPAGDRLEVRVGLHLGELVEEKGDIFGDAVNIAARVQPLADPGGIAMTATVHAQVRNQAPLRGVFILPAKLKNIPGRTSVFVVPPEGAAFPLWSLRRRGLPRALGAAAAAAVLGLAAGAYWWTHPGPVRVALLYIRAGEDDAARKMAAAIGEALELKVSSSPGFQWIDRNGVLDLFAQEGLKDLSQIENLEFKACTVARKGGLQYSLIGRLSPAGKDRWRLESKIVCTKSRAIVGNFASESSDPAAIAADHLKQLRAWALGWHLVAS